MAVRGVLEVVVLAPVLRVLLLHLGKVTLVGLLLVLVEAQVAVAQEP
jgi:hypothetical protein